MTKPPVVHIASTHRAFDSRIFDKECRSLARSGYDVTLIVPHDRNETVDGVRIRAVPLPESGKERLTRTLGKLYRAARSEPRGAIYHFHDAELIFHMLRLARSGRRIIYDAHEITRMQVRHMAWIPRLIRPLVGRIMHAAEQRGDKRFEGIIGAVPAILDQFDNPRRALVRNYPFAARYRLDEPTPYSNRPAHLFYPGGLTEARGLHVMMKAVANIPDRMHARLRLAGSFHPQALEQEITSWDGYSGTTWLGWLDSAGLVRELDAARIGLVVLQPTEQYVLSYPTKLFQYMAAGIPVIASDFPLWRDIIESCGCGLLVDPTSAGEVAEAATYLLEQEDEAEAMGMRGLKAAHEMYDWSTEEATLLSFYRTIVDAHDAHDAHDHGDDEASSNTA